MAANLSGALGINPGLFPYGQRTLSAADLVAIPQEIVIPSPGAVDQYIIANPIATAFYVDPGANGAVTLNETAIITAGVNPIALGFRGVSAKGGVYGWENYASGGLVTVPSKASIITVTSACTATNQIVWTGCSFRNLAFNAPTFLGNPNVRVFMWGRSSVGNKFEECGFFDSCIGWTRATGLGLTYKDCAWGESGAINTSWNGSGTAPAAGTFFFTLTGTVGTAGTGVNIQVSQNGGGATTAVALAVAGVAYPVTIKVAAGDTLAFTQAGGSATASTGIITQQANYTLTPLDIAWEGTTWVNGHYTNGLFGVQSLGADNGGITYGVWRMDHLIYRGLGNETVPDLEFSPATQGPQFYAGVIDVQDAEGPDPVNVTLMSIGRITQHVTAARGGSCPLMRTFTVNPVGTLTPGSGIIEYGIVEVIQDDTYANGAAGAAVFTVTGSDTSASNVPFLLKKFHIGTMRAQINGKAIGAGGGGSAAPFNFGVNTSGVTSYSPLEEWWCGELTFGWTSLPSTPGSIFNFSVTGDGSHTYTFPSILFGKVLALGATTASGLWAATVGGNTMAQFISFGASAQVNAVAVFGWDLMDFSQVTPTGTQPYVFTTGGTFSFTNIKAGQLVVGDPIGTVSTLSGSPLTYTHGKVSVSGNPYQGRGTMLVSGGTSVTLTYNGTAWPEGSTIPRLKYNDVVVISWTGGAGGAPTITLFPDN